MEPSLEQTTFFDPPGFNFPYGCHLAEVEIDQETCQLQVTRLVAVHDVGVIGNPKVLEGQFHGAMAFGLGEALLEQAVYSNGGHLLTRTLSDYPLPRALQIPPIELESMVTPHPGTALGAKGAGELGTVGVVAALGNAVHDALADCGVGQLDLPLTPEKIWRAIRNARHFSAGSAPARRTSDGSPSF